MYHYVGEVLGFWVCASSSYSAFDINVLLRAENFRPHFLQVTINYNLSFFKTISFIVCRLYLFKLKFIIYFE